MVEVTLTISISWDSPSCQGCRNAYKQWTSWQQDQRTLVDNKGNASLKHRGPYCINGLWLYFQSRRGRELSLTVPSALQYEQKYIFSLIISYCVTNKTRFCFCNYQRALVIANSPQSTRLLAWGPVCREAGRAKWAVLTRFVTCDLPLVRLVSASGCTYCGLRGSRRNETYCNRKSPFCPYRFFLLSQCLLAPSFYRPGPLKPCFVGCPMPYHIIFWSEVVLGLSLPTIQYRYILGVWILSLLTSVKNASRSYPFF